MLSHKQAYDAIMNKTQSIMEYLYLGKETNILQCLEEIQRICCEQLGDNND